MWLYGVKNDYIRQSPPPLHIFLLSIPFDRNALCVSVCLCIAHHTIVWMQKLMAHIRNDIASIWLNVHKKQPREKATSPTAVLFATADEMPFDDAIISHFNFSFCSFSSVLRVICMNYNLFYALWSAFDHIFSPSFSTPASRKVGAIAERVRKKTWRQYCKWYFCRR